MQKVVVWIILFFCFSGIAFGQKYETKFYDENSFDHPVEIPANVLGILKTDEDVRKCSDSSSDPKFSAAWFEATRINLNGDRLPELIVKAKDGCSLISGNASKFWFFLNRKNKYDLVLSDFTIFVAISKKRRKGFHDIGTSRSTAGNSYSTDYSFNGKRYIKRRDSIKPIKYK